MKALTPSFLTGGSMDIMTGISAGITAIRGTLDIARGAMAAHDQSLLEKAERDISKQMLDLLQTAFALEAERGAAVRRCSELEDENRKLKDFSSDMANYEPYQTKAGGFCLRAQPGV